MGTKQRSTTQILLLICSLIGAAIAIYLTSVHYENTPLVCSDQGLVNCAYVLSSPYSVVPGTSIPITIPGLGWSLVSAALAIIGLYFNRQQRWIYRAQFAWSLSGMLTIIYLLYIEIVRLHTICAWCTALHVIILLMFLVTIMQLQSPSSELTPEQRNEDEESVVTSASRTK